MPLDSLESFSCEKTWMKILVGTDVEYFILVGYLVVQNGPCNVGTMPVTMITSDFALKDDCIGIE